MIKEALAYITELATKAEKPEILEINGKTYCTKNLTRYDKEPMAKYIEATTLTALVDYIKTKRDELRESMIIQVEDETTVRLFSGLTKERERETLFCVKALLPSFDFGHEYDQERFLISLQSCFKESDDRTAVATVAANITDQQNEQYSDDGVTQQVVIKSGVAHKDNAIVPNPVNLTPYRTFLEVDQPASDFVFRIRKNEGSAPTFKLVAADGGVWKAEAVANVKNYLEEALKDIPNREQITIIA